jgi:hypothetical protein
MDDHIAMLEPGAPPVLERRAEPLHSKTGVAVRRRVGADQGHD